jgi:hypothetical protein
MPVVGRAELSTPRQVLSSQPVRHTYPVKNTGDAPLTIKDVKPG